MTKKYFLLLVTRPLPLSALFVSVSVKKTGDMQNNMGLSKDASPFSLVHTLYNSISHFFLKKVYYPGNVTIYLSIMVQWNRCSYVE